jgi:hypothetical protein
MITAKACINSLKPYTLAVFKPWIFPVSRFGMFGPKNLATLYVAIPNSSSMA